MSDGPDWVQGIVAAIAESRTEVRAGFTEILAQLRTEIPEVRAELHTEIVRVRTDVMDRTDRRQDTITTMRDEDAVSFGAAERA